jgi:hypothetical protein
MYRLGTGVRDASRLIDPRNPPRHQGWVNPLWTGTLTGSQLTLSRHYWVNPQVTLTERCEIWDSVSSNSIPPYLRTTAPTSSRQPTVPATTANSAGAPPRFPAPVSTEDRSGVGGSSDGQDEQRQIILPPETGEQPSLSSGWSDAPWLNRRRPGSLYSIVVR